jgi:phage shock protein E
MEKIKELMKQKNATVIDVRNEWEYAENHIAHAVNIPLDQIPAQLQELKKLNGPVILYCRSGARSGVATGLLKQAGITDVFNGGGIADIQKLILN